MPLREIRLSPTLKERLAQGHPWVYRNHVPPDVHLPSGTWVKVRCANWTGFGLWDAKGSLAIRIFSTRQLPDAHWLRDQVKAAYSLRSPLRQQDCTAYRWLFGEGDGLPGITVDLYGEFAVVQTYMEGATVLLDWLVDALKSIASLQGVPLQGIVLRSQHIANEGLRSIRDTESTGKTQLLWGKNPPIDLVVREYGLQFQVNLQTGQKTGLFLDHRDNRRFVEGMSRDRTVLNCFCYTGAFSLYALRGGASHVTSLDIGKGLAEAAEINVCLNALDVDRHTFVTADCFDWLDSIVSQKTFDIVILDPPSFAKSKQNRFAALRAYTKLNALALRCVAPGGFLVTASCTSQISPEAFKEMLATAGGNCQKQVQIIHEAGQAIDHPVPAQFPEGRYLKFIVGRVR
ncbi:class I SAM-dependent rRNA methyltransferase [Microcoleus sp. FACHB-1515]|uniref:class I SAM-dependent rRNA methyltransferase n=1 Tax=Cyanophyceae TaxID=3028117 RepID=UPI0016831D35|nr:class I SAM-dependent rRNA methyltransferase [Microcoleus sp. FACHB-1515]MBD2092788.1 class I SAM-dependent rRNA methyltransferase [Microcoleus sp. FACHB-1515]